MKKSEFLKNETAFMAAAQPVTGTPAAETMPQGPATPAAESPAANSYPAIPPEIWEKAWEMLQRYM